MVELIYWFLSGDGLDDRADERKRAGFLTNPTPRREFDKATSTVDEQNSDDYHVEHSFGWHGNPSRSIG
jgi:hypothetical protein